MILRLVFYMCENVQTPGNENGKGVSEFHLPQWKKQTNKKKPIKQKNKTLHSHHFFHLADIYLLSSMYWSYTDHKVEFSRAYEFTILHEQGTCKK